MALKKSLRKLLKDKFIKTTSLEEFTMDGNVYRVVDKTSIFPNYDDRRALCFKSASTPDRVKIHSMIYLNEKNTTNRQSLFRRRLLSFGMKNFLPKRQLFSVRRGVLYRGL